MSNSDSSRVYYLREVRAVNQNDVAGINAASEVHDALRICVPTEGQVLHLHSPHTRATLSHTVAHSNIDTAPCVGRNPMQGTHPALNVQHITPRELQHRSMQPNGQ